MDGKATVKLGPFSRGGKTRGEYKASDHDFGGTEHYIPCGILAEETAQLSVPCGSSAKTSDFLVDTLTAWWQGLRVKEQSASDRVQLKMDNGPERSGRRTQFLHRRVQLVDTIGKPFQVLSSPPSHSKYNPIERGWGILALPWNGTQLRDTDTMLEWAKRMTWQGINPVVTLSRKVYAKGVTLRKTAMHAVEARLERTPLLPKWDILIHPAKAT
jgi:DDE family transposase